MSQVTEQSVRFQTALASIKLIQASAVLDLTEDDFDFLTSNKVWIDRKSGSAGMPRPISYAVFCLKKKKRKGKVQEDGRIVLDATFSVQCGGLIIDCKAERELAGTVAAHPLRE